MSTPVTPQSRLRWLNTLQWGFNDPLVTTGVIMTALLPVLAYTEKLFNNLTVARQLNVGLPALTEPPPLLFFTLPTWMLFFIAIVVVGTRLTRSLGLMLLGVPLLVLTAAGALLNGLTPDLRSLAQMDGDPRALALACALRDGTVSHDPALPKAEQRRRAALLDALNRSGATCPPR